MKHGLIFAAVVSLVCMNWVHAQGIDFDVQVGQNSADAVALSQQTGGNWTFTNFPTGSLTLDKSTIITAPILGDPTLAGVSGLVIDSDPAINYGFGVTNNGSTPQTYTFTFPMPSQALAVNLPAGVYNVSATFGDTLTASPGDNASFSLVPNATTYQQSFINGSEVAVADIAPGANSNETVRGGTDGNTEVFSFTKSSGQITLGSAGTSMSVTTSFQLSPGDSASFSGSFTVSSAPEPSGLALGAVAALAFALMAFRFRASQV